jgi:phenylalanyl-tRNA synthetase alpha chain
VTATDRIEEIRSEAAEAISAAGSTGELEELRVRYLGRKAELTTILRGIAELPATERGPVGKAGNEARVALEEALEARLSDLDSSELQSRLAADTVDVTLPGSPPVPVGARNLLVRTAREIEDVFVGLGYRVMEGPEVELDYYNFTALNHPPGHPARMAQDTFYVDPATLAEALRIEPDDGGEPLPPGPEDVVLRTHTSPMQVRAMETQGPPIFIVVPGRCYRSDPFDATHSPVFHQVEGLAVDEGITFADLRGTLAYFARQFFGPGRRLRLLPSHFRFTEPSAEGHVSCFACDGSGCRICGHTGWIELFGCGMVHPHVFESVGYDPAQVTGFAFGMGADRAAMIRHGLTDLRYFWEGDLRVLEQFR